MESDRGGSDSLEVESEPKKRSLTLVIVAVVVIVVVIVAALAYIWWSPQEGSQEGAPQGETQADWYFIGAYADYEGEATYLSETMSFLMGMEVVDLNSTHWKSLLHMKMQSESLGTILDEQETSWNRIEETPSLGMEEMEGFTLERTYEDHVHIEGLGTKYCKIYEFISTDVDGADMTMTLYVDPEIVWPLKFSFRINVEDEVLIFDITLTDTNIPALT